MLNLPLQVSVPRPAMQSRHFSLAQSHSPSSLSCLFSMRPLPKTSSVHIKPKPCKATVTSSSAELTEETRRSSDYHPTIWDHRLIESISSPYEGGEFEARIGKLKQEVKQLLKETELPLDTLELIDSIRHLGLGYHFDEEIEASLARFYVDGRLDLLHGLRETALCFRLLREYGHFVSADVFKKFREDERFKSCLSQDVKGLLGLYEATHLALLEEKILEEAKEFSTKHLRCLGENTASNLVEQVKHSLEAPLRWLPPRVEARNFIDVYEKEEGKIACLLELAKLDFNVVQVLHQKEIKELSSWWESLGLVGKVGFSSRDRIFENYLWAIGNGSEPQFSKCRKVITKVISIGNVIDDFYDTYGTLEEAELFTKAIKRWDLNAMEGLPDYLQLCYFGLFNFVHETAYSILKEFGWDVSHLLANEWICLCESYLKEAEWFHKRITPSLDDYLENGWTSGGNRLLVIHALYYTGNDLKEESLDHLSHAHKLIYLSSLLVRLIDDLAPSKAEMENGMTSLSIQCHMKESGKSYEASKRYTQDLITNYWKELNKETLNSQQSWNFIYFAINSARTCFHMYQYGDGISDGTGIIKDRIKSLVVEPIPMQ